MSQNQSVAESIGSNLPLLLFFYWVSSTGLWGTDKGPWFLAVVMILGFECMGMVMEWMKPQPVPYDDPLVWFDRLAEALSRTVAVLYVAGAVMWVNTPYFVLLKTALPRLDFSLSAVWAPGLMGAILLANVAYALPMALRYGRSERAPGRIISAVLWMAGAVTLFVMNVFVPSSNSVLGPNATAALNFFILWIYLAVFVCNLGRLVVVWRGAGGAARDRAVDYVKEGEERDAWPTGE